MTAVHSGKTLMFKLTGCLLVLCLFAGMLPGGFQPVRAVDPTAPVATVTNVVMKVNNVDVDYVVDDEYIYFDMRPKDVAVVEMK